MAYDLCRHTGHRAIGHYIFEHDTACANAGPLTNGNVSEQLSVGADINALAHFRMTIAALLAAAGCGGNGTDPVPAAPEPAGPQEPAPAPDPAPEPPPMAPAPAPVSEPDCAEDFDGTFEAIQEVIFERRGCTAEACHGSSMSGDLEDPGHSIPRGVLAAVAVGFVV